MDVVRTRRAVSVGVAVAVATTVAVAARVVVVARAIAVAAGVSRACEGVRVVVVACGRDSMLDSSRVVEQRGG